MLKRSHPPFSTREKKTKHEQQSLRYIINCRVTNNKTLFILYLGSRSKKKLMFYPAANFLTGALALLAHRYDNYHENIELLSH